MLNISILLLIGYVPTAILAVYSFSMKELGLLYYGSTDGFFSVTIKTLIILLTGSYQPFLTYYFVLLIFLTLSAFLFEIIYGRITLRKIQIDVLFFLLLTGNILATLLLEKFFDINYPEDRVGLYFFPLTVGSALFLTDRVLSNIFSRWKWSLVALFLPFLLFPVHFVDTLNLNYAYNYKNDFLPEYFYEKVKKEHQKGDFPPTVGGYRLRHFVWNMNDFRNGGTESQIFSSSYPGLEADFQIGNLEDSEDWVKYYEIIATERINNRYLLKRKHFLDKIPVCQVGNISTNDTIKAEYFKLFQGPVDTLRGKTLYISLDLTIASTARPFQSWIVFNIKDGHRNDLRYERIPLDWLRTTWNGEPSNFMNGMILHDLPPDSETLLVYLWNIDKEEFSVSNGRITINQLQRDY